MTNKVWKHKEYVITLDKKDLDLDIIYNFLSKESYWSKELSKEEVAKSIKNSALCFGLYYNNPNTKKQEQIGFARVISDLVTFAYLSDVFILQKFRQQGLGQWLIQTIINYDELKIRRIMLCTEDGHSLYGKFGFEALDKPNMFMQIKGKGAL
ncbi:GNAT family N-acetyltransferase [Salipaludibacillus sp. HK11]|uniref:GNAT family N-acetyltransferase n=1 Tax=Salipaludibacillus sp. HK11 TaxID=3394320 RepID=UPI0039FDC453